jgi:hypothetical protein
MQFSVVEATDFLQCESASAAGSSAPCAGDLFLRYQENFATAFKVRGTTNQSIFGIEGTFNNESGYNNSALVNDHDLERAGYASQGTRLLARLAGVPTGSTVRVWSRNVYNGLSGCDDDELDDANPAFVAWRVNDADSVGAGGTPTTTSEWRAISTSGAAGSATWEVTVADSATIDAVYFAVDVNYTANTTAGVPALGNSTVNGSYAPLSTVGEASLTAPRPRFVDDSTATDLFGINSCATNLLWPYVTNQAGFDTGLVISNTSRDPFGTATQEGACVINYYGHTTGGGAAPAAVTTPRVPAGQHAVWTLSSGGTVLTGGGTIAAAPGFQGYVIAQCNFQFAHGYAFISDVGATRLAQGYLALVMDAEAGTLPRSGSESEPLGQ